MFTLQVVIGIGAKPAIGPFETLSMNKSIGGIQVLLSQNILMIHFPAFISFEVITSREITLVFSTIRLIRARNHRLMACSEQVPLEFSLLEMWQPSL